MDATQIELGTEVIVREFRSRGALLGDIRMTIVDKSVATHRGSISRVQLRNDELDFIGWFPVTKRLALCNQ